MGKLRGSSKDQGNLFNLGSIAKRTRQNRAMPPGNGLLELFSYLVTTVSTSAEGAKNEIVI